MTTVNKYGFMCTTENTQKIVWREENEPIPSTCPTNSAHTIDTSSMRILDSVHEHIVTVREENTPTGGHYKAECRSFSILPSQTFTIDTSWIYPITAMSVEFVTDAENMGDGLELIVGPDTIVGIITANVNINDTVINVSPTVIEHIKIGFKMNLFNGVNIEQLGYVLDVNKDNNTVTVQTPSTTAFSAASPTYVRMSVYVMENYTIGKPGRWVVGESKIGGSYVPKNTVVRSVYYNNTAATKNFTSQIEYLY